MPNSLWPQDQCQKKGAVVHVSKLHEKKRSKRTMQQFRKVDVWVVMDGGSHRGALLRSLLDPVMGSIADYQLPSAAAPFVLSQHSDKGLLPQSCSQRLSLVWRSRSIWFMSISGLHQRAVHWPGWIFLRTGLWTNTLPTQSFLWEWLELYHGLKALHAYFWFHGCYLLLSWS